MIELKNGRISKIVVSSILGHSGGGLFPYYLLPTYMKFLYYTRLMDITVFTKSATRFKRIGNFVFTRPWTWKYIKRLDNISMINAYGLTNGGVRKHAPEIASTCKSGFSVIPNFYPEFSNGIDEAILGTIEGVNIYKKLIDEFFWAVELNFSCPNSKEDIKNNMEMATQCVKSLKDHHPDIAIIAKTSIVHPFEFYEELERLKVDVIHSANSIPYTKLYSGIKGPFDGLKDAGVSGALAFEIAFKYNSELRKRVQLPLIMGCGVTTLQDVDRLFSIGADSVSICTAVALNTKESIRIVQERIVQEKAQ